MMRTFPIPAMFERRGSGIWTPARLGQQFPNFAWLEPNPITAMFQDAAGTTPVTATGQVVGRINSLDGLGHYASQSTTANKPTYQLSPQGSPAVQHDTTDVLTLTASTSLGATASVYYANQWGVQQSHGVNVGSSYNLPGAPAILSDYVYGHIITPTRPDAVTEGRIIQYLEKKIGVVRKNRFGYTDFSQADATAFTGNQWTGALSGGAQTFTIGVTDKDGGTGAIRVTHVAQYGGIAWRNFTAASGSTYTLSFWARRNSGTNTLDVFRGLPYGSIGTLSPTGTWTFYAFTFTASAAFSIFYLAQDRNGSNFGDVELCYPQLELGDSVTAYQKVLEGPGVPL